MCGSVGTFGKGRWVGGYGLLGRVGVWVCRDFWDGWVGGCVETLGKGGVCRDFGEGWVGG